MTVLHPLLQSVVESQKPRVEQVSLSKLFATPVFKFHIHDYNYLSFLVSKIYKLREQGTGVNGPNTWCTDDNLNKLDEFQSLNDLILDESRQILDFHGLRRDSHYITCMWSNVSKVGHSHQIHIHPNSFYSGVIYLQVPEGSGPLIFVDPRPSINMILPNYTKPQPDLFGSNCRVDPKLGDMYMFPSWAAHGVSATEWNPSQERISLSFNIMFKGETDATSARLTF